MNGARKEYFQLTHAFERSTYLCMYYICTLYLEFDSVESVKSWQKIGHVTANIRQQIGGGTQADVDYIYRHIFCYFVVSTCISFLIQCYRLDRLNIAYSFRYSTLYIHAALHSQTIGKTTRAQNADMIYILIHD